MGKFKGPDVEENVGCNLIPMIDIMFLLLLFFMLSADMSQREIENVTLPQADQVKEEDNKRGKFGITNVNIALKNADLEPKDQARAFLENKENWSVAIRGKVYTDWELMKSQLAEEANLDLEDTPDPVAKVKLSGRTLLIRADQYAPYELIQAVIQVASAAKIYKVEVAAAKPKAPEGAAAK